MATDYNHYRPVQRLGRLLKSENKIIYLILFYALINGIIVLTLPLGIQAIVNFLIIAFVLFLIVRGYNKLQKEKEAAPPPPPEPSPEEVLLTEIRDLIREKN